jgi:predicted RNA binding protein YcfA (HicA-like mRNA interferase family)
MNFRQVKRNLEADGWKALKQKGTSHVQFKHPTKKGKVTVPNHGSKDIPPGTLNAIMKQAGLK